jgi:hypothetical protein
MAKAAKIGFPAFMSELRTTMAPMTVHSSGEKPSTSRNGMLADWTITTEVIWPKRRARLGWASSATTVPRLVNAKRALSDARSSPNFC